MVGVVDDQGRVSIKKITIGRDMGVNLVITSGLDTSDKVIVNPPDSLSTGDLVVPKLLPAPPKPEGKVDAKGDAKGDGKGEVKVEGKGEGKGEAKSDSKGEVKGEAKAEAKSDSKTEAKPGDKPNSDRKSGPNPDVKQEQSIDKMVPKDSVIAPKPSSMSQFKGESTDAKSSGAPNLLAPAQQTPAAQKPAVNNSSRSPS
jgi:hypothetical protein